MLRSPSPSLVLSVVAVVLAGAGTSIAAIDYARNAGAVDGRSAVSATASNAKAAKKLVATGRSGRIPIKFLDLGGIMRGSKATFAQSVEVADNASGAPVAIGGTEGVGLVTIVCNDQAGAAGAEDPAATVTFTNSSGQTVSYSRVVGRGNPEVTALAPATQSSFTINNSNTFRIYAQVGATHYVLDGNVRQDGKATATGSCATWGYALVL